MTSKVLIRCSMSLRNNRFKYWEFLRVNEFNDLLIAFWGQQFTSTIIAKQHTRIWIIDYKMNIENDKIESCNNLQRGGKTLKRSTFYIQYSNFCLFLLLFKEHTESCYMSFAPLDLPQYISIYYSIF